MKRVLWCRQHTLRIPTGDIHDPVKRDLEKSVREKQQLMPSRRRTPPVAGKETLSTTLWDKLESTPCGHHMDHDGNYITKALTPEELLLRRSDVVFDDYNVITGEQDAISSYLLCAELHFNSPAVSAYVLQRWVGLQCQASWCL